MKNRRASTWRAACGLPSEGVELRIGCHHKPLAEWQQHYKAIGRVNGYTPAQIREYGAHITYIAWWAKHLPKEK